MLFFLVMPRRNLPGLGPRGHSSANRTAYNNRDDAKLAVYARAPLDDTPVSSGLPTRANRRSVAWLDKDCP